jgi:hypothetical protein
MVKRQDGLRVISLNTDMWYKANYFNYINLDAPDNSGMLRFLTDELQAAEDAGDRVWIVGHVLSGWDGSNRACLPSFVCRSFTYLPFSSGEPDGLVLPDRGPLLAACYRQCVLPTPCLKEITHSVQDIFFGHTHEDQASIFYANNATDISAQSALVTSWVRFFPSILPHMVLMKFCVLLYRWAPPSRRAAA